MNRLATLRSRDIIRDIDLELCRFLKQQHPDISEEVLLAASLVSYLYRQGDVCCQLEKYASQTVFEEGDGAGIKAPDLRSWKKVLSECPAVGRPTDFKPLILDEAGRLYLHKLWHYENNLAEQLIKRSRQQAKAIDIELLRDGLQRLFDLSEGETDWQAVAAASSVKNKLSIISGGPGTGKTSTVVRVLVLLMEQARSRNSTLNIALTAPTGKAAGRLKNSIVSARDELEISEEIREGIPEKAKTLHQLLGARRHTSSFRHDKDNPLPYDLIIIDEASMVDQALMSKLMNALLEDTRLILLGDKDQLASVEAGSVLGDICDKNRNQLSSEMAEWLERVSLDIPGESVIPAPMPLTDNITLLTKSYRFKERSGIAQLAQSINDSNPEQALAVLQSPKNKDTSLIPIEDQNSLEQALKTRVYPYFRNIMGSNSAGEALEAFNAFRILSAHRKGPWGVEYLNQLVEKILIQERLVPKYNRWYTGKPVIVNENDYKLGLHNGDTGICFPDEDGQLKVFFRHENTIRTIAPGRLPKYDSAFALTVHKSQGSEFDELLLILPDNTSKVLSRELIYTAITRARKTIAIAGSESVLNYSISKQLQRSSGLRDHLWH